MYKGFDLSGKVAVLTGSTAGMGFAIARGFPLPSLEIKGCHSGRKVFSLICEPENRRRDQARAHAIFGEFLLASGVFTLTY